MDNARKFEKGKQCVQRHLYEHFNLLGHSRFLYDASVTLIDKTDPKNPTKREDFGRTVFGHLFTGIISEFLLFLLLWLLLCCCCCCCWFCYFFIIIILFFHYISSHSIFSLYFFSFFVAFLGIIFSGYSAFLLFMFFMAYGDHSNVIFNFCNFSITFFIALSWTPYLGYYFLTY